MKEVRVTSITAFNMCAYAFKNDVYDPNPVKTYKGDLLNIAASVNNAQQSVWMFLKWYMENLNGSQKEAQIMAEVMDKCKHYIQWLKMKTNGTMWSLNKWWELYQEAKMMYKYSDDRLITGQPDLFYLNTWEFDKPMWVVEDLKCSTKSWYGNEEVIKYDAQLVIYPLFVMDRFGVDEVIFRHKLYDNKNGKDYYLNQKLITKEYALQFVDEVMKKYIIANELDDREANFNPKCNFCNLKETCPLFKAMWANQNMKVAEDYDDDLGW